MSQKPTRSAKDIKLKLPGSGVGAIANVPKRFGIPEGEISICCKLVIYGYPMIRALANRIVPVLSS
jgi:hypothetical protein